jgi:hypothetical protein
LIKLQAAPHLDIKQNVWEMTWSVKNGPQAPIYSIRLVLDRKTRLPLSIVDVGNFQAPDVKVSRG